MCAGRKFARQPRQLSPATPQRPPPTRPHRAAYSTFLYVHPKVPLHRHTRSAFMAPPPPVSAGTPPSNTTECVKSEVATGKPTPLLMVPPPLPPRHLPPSFLGPFLGCVMLRDGPLQCREGAPFRHPIHRHCSSLGVLFVQDSTRRKAFCWQPQGATSTPTLGRCASVLKA